MVLPNDKIVMELLSTRATSIDLMFIACKAIKNGMTINFIINWKINYYQLLVFTIIISIRN